MNRIREGYALVRNPIAKNVIHRVDLTPMNIDLLLLMTKDPRPMIPFIGELKERKVNFGFQVTITPYGRDIEPGVPNKADVAEGFRTISDMIGRNRIVWRYDPVILNDKIDIKFHQRKFSAICGELAGYTDRCIFSFVEIHGKLKRLSDEGTIRKISEAEAGEIGRSFSETAKDSGIELTLCCSEVDLSRYGISTRGCIDKEHMRAAGVPFEELHTPIRAMCQCVKNVDIGEYDTCDHNCIYCYANRNTDKARKEKNYDPKSEMLFGGVRECDVVAGPTSRKTPRITDF
jgi:DNA repair photolyase